MNIDVVIIGASSAGLYAAEQLARAGKRVAVFEQQKRLAPARRTLIITPQLQQVLGYVPDDAVLHRIHTLVLAEAETQASVRLREPDLIIERSSLAQVMLERARAAGVAFYFDHRFQGLEAASEGVVVRLRTAEDQELAVVARALIGADGILSDVARTVGLRHPPTVPILQAEVRLPPDWDAGITQVWFDTTETRFFYWLIPESSGQGVVGLVGDDGEQTRRLLQRFLSRLGLQPLAYQGAQVAMYDRSLQPYTHVNGVPVMLVGDAAGQVKVTTVGGTVSGIWGAQAAVRALLQGTSYLQELQALNRELGLHGLMRDLLDRADNGMYRRLIEQVSPGVQQFLARYNRDQMAGRLWMLLLRQPGLAVTGLRLLLRPASLPVPPAQVEDMLDGGRLTVDD